MIGIANNMELKGQVSRTELDAHRMTVEVDGSTVRLGGTARSCAGKGDAERVAWSSPGVTQVENCIIIVP
jgi:osmotically-inducible protein OsmY